MDRKTILDYIKEILGDEKKLKVVLIILSALAVLMLISFQILPFLIFLILGIIAYLQLRK